MSHPLVGVWTVSWITKGLNAPLGALQNETMTISYDGDQVRVQTSDSAMNWTVTSDVQSSAIAGKMTFNDEPPFFFFMVPFEQGQKMMGSVVPCGWIPPLPSNDSEIGDYDCVPGGDEPGTWVADQSGGNEPNPSTRKS